MVFTEEAPVDSFVEDSKLSQTVQAQFDGMFLFLFSLPLLSPLILEPGFSYNGTHLATP